jgi:hypothetical protein
VRKLPGCGQNVTCIVASFDRNQIKEFIGRVENDTAEFIGAEFKVARIVGAIYKQTELGNIEQAEASQMLHDLHHLSKLVATGYKYARMARNPVAEIRIMVLAEERRLTQ